MDDAGIWNLETIKNQQKLNQILMFAKKRREGGMYMQFSLHCYYDTYYDRSSFLFLSAAWLVFANASLATRDNV
jgi:hypothetical protein